MKTYFECHITMVGDPAVIRPVVEAAKWKFSVIDGDPVLGEGVKCYATQLFKRSLGEETVLSMLLDTAKQLENSGFKVLRRKVELVIYDDKAKSVRCTGGCPECHLDDIPQSRYQQLMAEPHIGPIRDWRSAKYMAALNWLTSPNWLK